ncbi:hypothetical protein HJG60_010457 [Phyllostomus discolor]|uniref:Uncharacterized protein n=1 Tax=Phyllostomus discolor TaxID=89673 RepID=A0A834AN14_9CHIR|nr:hypothetical protein HJG60_010457 [Phyllostomus discolor]
MQMLGSLSSAGRTKLPPCSAVRTDPRGSSPCRPEMILAQRGSLLLNQDRGLREEKAIPGETEETKTYGSGVVQHQINTNKILQNRMIKKFFCESSALRGTCPAMLEKKCVINYIKVSAKAQNWLARSADQNSKYQNGLKCV